MIWTEEGPGTTTCIVAIETVGAAEGVVKER